jgi:two-component system KDP operon response regulator KdpE
MEAKRILVIDDDLDIRLGLNARLRANGYEAVFAEDCIGALRVAQQEKPDVILLDLGLPGGDGFMVLDQLKENTGLASIPVLVLSARDAEENERRALRAGAEAFLEKPAENGDLLGAIARAIA